jgi:hypothetical protein
VTALEDLLDRARGPMGPAVEIDFGMDPPAWPQLGAALTRLNGFFVFNAGVQVFRVGTAEGWGPELGAWNEPGSWKETYQGLADDLFCFGQDLFGVQFAIDPGGQVVAFEPETGDRRAIGTSLDEWAAWLLSDPDVNGAAELARSWQDTNGPLTPVQRLIPLRFFVTGGTYDFANVKVEDAVTAMRIRGPVARQVHDLPDGARIKFSLE